MTRIIRTGDTPAARRNAHLRSAAEVVRLLSLRSSFDSEARDMAAFLVFALRGIYETIAESANVWDDRNYWKKAEELRETWRWSRIGADELEALIVAGRWEEVPGQILQLIPHLTGVTVQTVTRNSDWWCGAYRALKRAAASR
jgi:hypothetical protein